MAQTLPAPGFDDIPAGRKRVKASRPGAQGRGVSLIVNEQSLLWGEAHIPPRVHTTEHSAHLADYLCPHEPEWELSSVLRFETIN